MEAGNPLQVSSDKTNIPSKIISNSVETNHQVPSETTNPAYTP